LCRRTCARRAIAITRTFDAFLAARERDAGGWQAAVMPGRLDEQSAGVAGAALVIDVDVSSARQGVSCRPAQRPMRRRQEAVLKANSS
jgi:hypothetical protein